MFYVTRRFICERLVISNWASYGLFKATDIGRIPSNRVTELLNHSRRAHEPEVDFIPSDIVTAEQLEQETGIPARKILTWTRRFKKVPPHYRINKMTTRFRRSSFNEWLERRTRG